MVERRGVLVGLVLAASLMWGSSRLTWVTATVSDDLRGVRSLDLTGTQWAGELVALALAALAAVAAVLAVRGRWPLRSVAALVVVIGAAALVPAIRLLAGGPSVDRAAGLLDAGVTRVAVQAHPGGALLAVAGGVLCAGAGLLLLGVPSRARGLSERYQTPGARRDAAVGTTGPSLSPSPPPTDGGEDNDVRQRQLWDALDAGVDPTAESSTDDGSGVAESLPGDTPMGARPHTSVTLSRDPTTDRGDGGSIP